MGGWYCERIKKGGEGKEVKMEDRMRERERLDASEEKEERGAKK